MNQSNQIIIMRYCLPDHNNHNRNDNILKHSSISAFSIIDILGKEISYGRVATV